MKRLTLHSTLKNNTENNVDQNYLPLVFNVCFAGQLSSPLSENGNTLLREFFTHLAQVISPYQAHQYGFCEDKYSINVIYSSTNCDIPLESIIPEPVNFCHIYSRQSQAAISARTTNISLDLPEPFDANSYHEIINWMMEKSDLFVTLWDGTKEFNGGLIWSAILQVQKKNIPVIWFDPAAQDALFLFSNGRNIPLEKDFLTRYIHDLLGLGGSREKLSELKNLVGAVDSHKTWFAKYYGNFIKKFKLPAAPTSKDDLIEENTHLPESMKAYEGPYLQLKSAYKIADEIAIAENNNYRSALYLKAVLPFIVNLILIFGFYARTLGFLLPFESWLWDIIIAVSFGFQFACQLFIIRVSDQNNRKGWQKKFIDQRYIAEVLRLSIHFLPINLPLNNNAASIFANNLPKDSPVSHRIRAILRNAGMNSTQIPSETEREFFFSNTDKLIKHQKDYHEYSAKKYDQINRELTKKAWALFYAGLIAIGLRVFLQFFFLTMDTHLVDLSMSKNVHDAIQAFSNLLALIVPSSGVMIFSIMSLCDFGNLSRRSLQMVGNLSQLKERLENERLNKKLTYDDYCRLAKQISTLLLQETTDWYALINTKKITKN
jgi:hypothetical protein